MTWLAKLKTLGALGLALFGIVLGLGFAFSGCFGTYESGPIAENWDDLPGTDSSIPAELYVSRAEADAQNMVDAVNVLVRIYNTGGMDTMSEAGASGEAKVDIGAIADDWHNLPPPDGYAGFHAMFTGALDGFVDGADAMDDGDGVAAGLMFEEAYARLEDALDILEL
jgi:hypothetical protein